MTEKKQKELQTVLQKAFKDSYELGGGKEFRYFHGVRVATIAMRIVEEEKLILDKEALFIAALFHDIGKVKAIDQNGEIQYESLANKNHDNLSINVLESYIENMVHNKIIKKAANIIRENVTGQLSLEGQVLRDADELGNFGYLQVWKTCTYAALSKTNIKEALEHWNNQRLNDRKTLAENLHFEFSRKLASKRYKRFLKFLKIIDLEQKGLD